MAKLNLTFNAGDIIEHGGRDALYDEDYRKGEIVGIRKTDDWMVIRVLAGAHGWQGWNEERSPLGFWGVASKEATLVRRRSGQLELDFE